VRKIVTFGEDLRAYEDVDFAGPDALAHLAEGVLAPGAVAVDPEHARVRKMSDERVFDPLGPLPDRRQVGIPARRARRGHVRLVAAVVAMKLARRHVQHELRGAAVAA
jgi:hypothetical protein